MRRLDSRPTRHPAAPHALGATVTLPELLRRALAAGALLLTASNCFVEFGPARSSPGDAGIADGASCDCRIDGLCHAAGEVHPDDPCRGCRPDRFAEAWSDRCPRQLTERTFADFSDGTMPRSLGNLYVSADGAVRVVRSGDIDEDGYFDLVFSNQIDGTSRAIDSYVYWGSIDGYSESRRAGLPTIGAYGNSVADLDVDGFLDLVFSNHSDGSSTVLDSYVYWGSAEGYSVSSRTELPTMGAYGSSVADLDGDGYLDIVFANEDDGDDRAIDSLVYWGSSTGFSAGSRTALPTTGAHGTTVADLNRDGQLDLVFSNWYDGTSFALDSYIYWGSKTGFSAGNRAELPTLGASGNSVADLDGDGFLDVVFSNSTDGTTNAVDSYVYWGSATGFTELDRTQLPTLGAKGSSVADLDGDGLLDIVVSNFYDGVSYAVESYVYWGSVGPFATADRTGVPTIGAVGNSAADLDGDGFLDLVFSNFRDATTFVLDSYIYWGSIDGFSSADRTGLPTVGAHLGTDADLGNVYDRRPEEEYISSVLDLGEGASATAIAWAADTPLGSSVSLQLRSAPERAAVSSAPWLGPGADSRGVPDRWYERPFLQVSAAHAGHRYLQYRALFRTPGFLGRPVLHSMTVFSDGGGAGGEPDGGAAEDDGGQIDAAPPDAGSADRDGDGFPDDGDNCPDTPNEDQLDCEADGIGDACEDPALDSCDETGSCEECEACAGDGPCSRELDRCLADGVCNPAAVCMTCVCPLDC